MSTIEYSRINFIIIVFLLLFFKVKLSFKNSGVKTNDAASKTVECKAEEKSENKSEEGKKLNRRVEFNIIK